MPRLLTATQAAEYLGISRKRFQRFAHGHDLERIDSLEQQHVAAGMEVSQADDGDSKRADHACGFPRWKSAFYPGRTAAAIARE